MATVPESAARRGPITADDALECEGPDLVDENPDVERIRRRLCRISYVEARHWIAIERLTRERDRLEAELDELVAVRP